MYCDASVIVCSCFMYFKLICSCTVCGFYSSPEQKTPSKLVFNTIWLVIVYYFVSPPVNFSYFRSFRTTSSKLHTGRGILNYLVPHNFQRGDNHNMYCEEEGVFFKSLCITNASIYYDCPSLLFLLSLVNYLGTK